MKVSAQPVPSATEGGSSDAAFQIEVARLVRETRKDQQQFRNSDLATKTLRMVRADVAEAEARDQKAAMAVIKTATKLISQGSQLEGMSSMGEKMGPEAANNFVDALKSKGTGEEMLETELSPQMKVKDLAPGLEASEIDDALKSGALSKEELGFALLDTKVPGESVFGKGEDLLNFGIESNDRALEQQGKQASRMPKDATRSESAKKNLEEVASSLKSLLSGLLRG